MNCSNCGSRISTLKCEYCGTLNVASPQQEAILGEHGKKRANLVEKLKTIEKMKMPEKLKNGNFIKNKISEKMNFSEMDCFTL